MKAKIFGLARWIFDADTRGIHKGADEAKQAVREVGEEGEKAGRKVDSAFSKAGEGIEKRTEGLRRFSGALGSTIGIAAGAAGAILAVANAVKATNDYFKDGKKLADEFLGSLDTVNNTEAAYAALQERLRQVTLELEAKEAGGIQSLSGRFKRQIEQEIEALRSRLSSINQQLQRQRQQQQREEIRQFAKSVEDETRGREINLLPDKEKIEATAEYAREKFKQAAESIGLDLSDEVVQRRLALIAAEEKMRMDELKKRLALAEESARKQAQEIADALNLSTSDFTTRLDTIVAGIYDISRDLGKR